MKATNYRAIQQAVQQHSNVPNNTIDRQPFLFKLCDVFESDNPHFNRTRFLQGCEPGQIGPNSAPDDFTNKESFKTEISEGVRKVKGDILADIASGNVSGTVKSYSELHDYLDANDYIHFIYVDQGVFTQSGDIAKGLESPEGSLATTIANAVMEEVDTWLANGRKEVK